MKKIEELEHRERFHVGDVIRNVEIIMPGNVTGGNTLLVLQISLPKLIGDDIESVKLTSSGPITVRGPKGYINELSYERNVKVQDLWNKNFFDKSEVLFVRQLGCLSIRGTKSAGFGNVDANSCVTGNIIGLTIEFL